MELGAADVRNGQSSRITAVSTGRLLISFVLKISKLQIAAYVSVLISGGSSVAFKIFCT